MPQSPTPYMSLKTDEQLQTYITDLKRYTTETVDAAVEELQLRGRIFTREELEHIKARQAEKEVLMAENNKFDFFSLKKWRANVVTDMDTPSIYSQAAIYGFCIFLSVFFGAVLLAINGRRLGIKKMILPVVAFGVLYTVLQVWVLSLLPKAGNVLTLALNGVGALVLNEYFWKKYIGPNLNYRAKSIWPPLIIAILITVPFLLLAFYFG